MAGVETTDHLSSFLELGIYRFESSNVVFMDPVRILNRSYTRFRVSPSSYYSRFFNSTASTEDPTSPKNSRKRKRKEKKSHTLNEREQVANQRHEKAKPFLLKAHESLLEATDLLAVLRNLRDHEFSTLERTDCELASGEHSFVELGSVWQAPLFEINLYFHPDDGDGGSPLLQYKEKRVMPLFHSLVANETGIDADAEFLNSKYILPKESCFYMQLAHEGGALVALWVTNKEKLRFFVEKDLFPKWGVKYVATYYWLKVKPDGSLLGELDLFHHRPYECLLLGYYYGKAVDSECLSRLKSIPDSQVLISVPGDYSRKPPIGDLLLEYVPGSKPARCIDLFAREMIAGWTSWGNEPLHFQQSKYFWPRKNK